VHVGRLGLQLFAVSCECGGATDGMPAADSYGIDCDGLRCGIDGAVGGASGGIDLLRAGISRAAAVSGAVMQDGSGELGDSGLRAERGDLYKRAEQRDSAELSGWRCFAGFGLELFFDD